MFFLVFVIMLFYVSLFAILTTSCFFFNDTATTKIYTYGHTLSLHDALPISRGQVRQSPRRGDVAGDRTRPRRRHFVRACRPRLRLPGTWLFQPVRDQGRPPALRSVD